MLYNNSIHLSPRRITSSPVSGRSSPIGVRQRRLTWLRTSTPKGEGRMTRMRTAAVRALSPWIFRIVDHELPLHCNGRTRERSSRTGAETDNGVPSE